MRAVIFCIYLSFLLQLGGNYSYVETLHTSKDFTFSQSLKKKQQVKHKNSNHKSIVNDCADIDLDEDFQISDNLNYGNVTPLLLESNNYYLTFSKKFTFKDYSKEMHVFAPFCRHSNPIYIRQSVLRI